MKIGANRPRVLETLPVVRAQVLPAPGAAQGLPAEAPLSPDAENRGLPPPATSPTGPLESGLDAELQKARIAALLTPPFQLLPMAAAPAQLKAINPPDGGLRKPDAAVVAQLTDRLKAALKQAESGTEEGRKAVDEVLQETVKAYGIGQGGVTGLEYDPKFADQGGTIGSPGQPRTFIVIGKSALASPEELASTILHESSHVRRNKELADAGIDRDSLGVKAQAVYEALIEAEAYDVEVRNTKKLGTSASYVKGAEQLKRSYLDQLEVAGGKEWRTLAEKGQFQQLHERFRQELLKKT